jgi:hypothetical protein
MTLNRALPLSIACEMKGMDEMVVTFLWISYGRNQLHKEKDLTKVMQPGR